MSRGYRYTDPDLAQASKPYGFAPLEGPEFLSAFDTDRDRFCARLRRDQALAPAADEAWRERWAAGSPPAFAPRDDTDADARCTDYIQRRDAQRAAGVVHTAWLLETILTAVLPDGLPLETRHAWTHDLDRLLRRYETFGRIYEKYTAEWKRAGDRANAPEVLARLAAGAAWRASSAASASDQLFALNVLLKLLDRATLVGHAQAAPLAPPDAAWLLGAIHSERTLVRHWIERGRR